MPGWMFKGCVFCPQVGVGSLGFQGSVIPSALYLGTLESHWSGATVECYYVKEIWGLYPEIHWEELKSLLMKVKEESGKGGLKLNIQRTKIIASGPITSWQIDGERMQTVTDFIFLGSKITADGDCSHKIKRHLLLGRKTMTNLDSMLKSRDVILPTKVCLVKAMVFLVVMHGCESWTLK